MTTVLLQRLRGEKILKLSITFKCVSYSPIIFLTSTMSAGINYYPNDKLRCYWLTSHIHSIVLHELSYCYLLPSCTPFLNIKCSQMWRTVTIFYIFVCFFLHIFSSVDKTVFYLSLIHLFYANVEKSTQTIHYYFKKILVIKKNHHCVVFQFVDWLACFPPKLNNNVKCSLFANVRLKVRSVITLQSETTDTYHSVPTVPTKLWNTAFVGKDRSSSVQCPALKRIILLICGTLKMSIISMDTMVL